MIRQSCANIAVICLCIYTASINADTTILPDDGSKVFIEKIVYASTKNGDRDVWMMNPDGTERELLLFGPGSQAAPKISPDGTKLSYLNPLPPSSWTLNYLDLVTGQEQIVYDTSYIAPLPNYAWLPDSSGFVISFPPSCSQDLYEIDLGGNFTPVLTSGTSLLPWAVSDAGVLLYGDNPCWTPNLSVKTYDLSDGTITLVQGPDGRAEQPMDISSDGQLIVYIKADSSYVQPRRVHTIEIDGSNELQISSSVLGTSDEHSVFSPDNSQVIFSRQILSNPSVSSLNIVSVDGSNEHTIISDGYSNGDPSWGLLLVASPTPIYSCEGFQPPAHIGPITVKGNRAIPLKAQLLDEFGLPQTDGELTATPVVQVLFSSVQGGDPIDVSDDAVPSGKSSDGNQFSFADGEWRFNLGTKNFSASGTYTASMVSGAVGEYIVEPGGCSISFVIN